jgi:hypothetical protein
MEILFILLAYFPQSRHRNGLTNLRISPPVSSAPFHQKQLKHTAETEIRVVDPYSFFTDPDTELDVGGQYGSGSGSNKDPGL